MPDESAAERLRVALDMFEFGERMQRARLVREHPQGNESETVAAVQEWLLRRPDAPFGDAVGHVSDRLS